MSSELVKLRVGERAFVEVDAPLRCNEQINCLAGCGGVQAILSGFEMDGQLGQQIRSRKLPF